MRKEGFHVVTGAFGYTGKHIARVLIDRGEKVRTLTNSVNRRNPFEPGTIEARPYNFDNPDALAASLEGAAVLYNTYWVRFNYKGFTTHAAAVENTRKLFEAAKRAGVRRVVHISITNPSEDSPLEYFSGKAKQEKALIESGLSYAILRPAVIFGKEDILINNIAWALRRFPVFLVFGKGEYRLRPIFVKDIAGLAVDEGTRGEDTILDAVGPESFTYRELVYTIAETIGVRRLIVSAPPSVTYAFGAMIGKMTGDVMITREEIAGLMAGLLDTGSRATGHTRLTGWIKENASTLGVRYASELARRLDRESAYDKL